MKTIELYYRGKIASTNITRKENKQAKITGNENIPGHKTSDSK